MKPLNQDDLYHNLREFLKDKGIDLQQGSYARGIQKSCSLLTDAINLGQQSFGRAKTEIDKKLDQMRQVIHEKTAPTSSTPPPATDSTKSAPPPKSATAKPRARKKKTRK